MALVRDVIERLSAVGELPSLNQLVGVPSAELDAWELELGIEQRPRTRGCSPAVGSSGQRRCTSVRLHENLLNLTSAR